MLYHYERIVTLPVLRADEGQVCVMTDLLIETQGLLQRPLLLQLVLDLPGALQQLIGLLGERGDNEL